MARCNGCKQFVTGSHITALGSDWHSSCFTCGGCGKPIGNNSFYNREGLPYHPDCFHQRFSPRCAKCGNVIVGSYITALGKTWHDVHFECARCGLPFLGTGYYLRDGQAYCKQHYEELFVEPCAICKRPLVGRYITNHWGQKYCAGHAEVYVPCFACHRLICEELTGGGVIYKDGRQLCNLCQRSAIVEIGSRSREVVSQVRSTLRRHGIDPPQAEIPFQLVRQEELDQSGSRLLFTNHLAGVTYNSWSTLGGQVLSRKTEKILMLSGMPTTMFAAVAAHELCHSYLFLSGFPKMSPFVEEGLCEVAASLWLAEQGTPEAEYYLKNMDSEHNDNPIYGTGYRTAVECLEKHSFAWLLDYVRRNAHFPNIE